MVLPGGQHSAQGSCPAGMLPALSFTVPWAGEGQTSASVALLDVGEAAPRGSSAGTMCNSLHSLPGLMQLIVSSTMPHLICDKDSFTQGLTVEWKNGGSPSFLHPFSSSHILPIVPTSFPAPVHLGVSRDCSSGLGWVRLSGSPALLLPWRLLLSPGHGDSASPRACSKSCSGNTSPLPLLQHCHSGLGPLYLLADKLLGSSTQIIIIIKKSCRCFQLQSPQNVI